jgi:hypothetical protein
MCALCKAVFATKQQWNDHWDDICSAPTTPPSRREKKYCHTCRTLFNSKESNDLHEPCPEKERESETRAVMAVTVRVAKKSRDTKSPIDQILCRYCKANCEATIHDPRYERTDCPPRISDQEQSRRRRPTAPTTTPDAHSNACPGLVEVGSGGPCTSHRHILEPPSDKGTATLKSTIPDKARTRNVFTGTRVSRTATAYGQYGASMSMDGHNSMRPRKRKCDKQGEENHDSDTEEDGIVRETTPMDIPKTFNISNETQVDHNQNVLKLPNGISSVTMMRPGHGQPIQVTLPSTEPNQNWCTIRVDVPNHTVTAPNQTWLSK